MFTKAEKSKALLRAAMFGPSGSGKTYSALAIASGIAKEIKSRIAVIDTERGSAAKYADRFDFDTVELNKTRIENYVEMFDAAAKAGYKVLVIDSMSHAWQELLEEIEQMAKAKYGGNTFRAWGEGTPKQREFVDALLRYPGHIIATMRSKTEYIVEDNGKGKMAPRKVGLAPEQGKGIEYEFDVLFELSFEHTAHVTKDRTGKYQDKYIEKPGVDFGVELVKWLNEGKDAPPLPAADKDKKAAAPEAHGLPTGAADTIKKALREYYTLRNETIPAADFMGLLLKDCFKDDTKHKSYTTLSMQEAVEFTNYLNGGIMAIKSKEGK